MSKLEGLGEIYFHKLHPYYWKGGKFRGVANEIAIGEDIQQGRKEFIYVNRVLKYKGFEYYRDKDGFSPLVVLHDRRGRALGGVYAPLRSIKQKDETYLYSGGFVLPQENPVFRVWTEYYPRKEDNPSEVFFQVWRFNPHAPGKEGEELYKGKAAKGEKVEIGGFYISMPEVRYWASINVFHNPGSVIILASLWLGIGGLTLSTILKMVKRQ